jgi:beta-lactamase regulating signal transducer with metallopeptidase domain
LSGSPELSFLVKATILVTLGLGATLLATRARAATRHLLLTVTFGALLLLPLALVVIPQIAVPVSVVVVSQTRMQPQVGQRSEAPIRSNEGQAPSFSAGARASETTWLSAIRVVWAVGALLFLLPVARSVAGLKHLRRQALPWSEGPTHLRTVAADAGVARPVDILLHEELVTPVTCGVLRPAVLLPLDAAGWPDADLHRALAHELEHVRRGDWLVHLLARAACALYWFHPLAWTAWRQLCVEAERTCDDAVLRQSEGTAYAEQLVQLARRLQPETRQPLLAMASRSDLATRVKAILDLTQSRGRHTGRTAVAVVTAAIAVLLAISPLRATVAVTQEAAQPTRELTAIDRALFEAAEGGDLDRVASLMASGANVNAILYGDGSPLIAAARRGRLAVVQQLLDAGADPDLRVDGDGSPLIMAAANGHLDIVTLLLNRGASVDRIVQGDENALIQASANGHLPVVQLLVARGADVNTRILANQIGPGTGEWRTPLSQARKGRHAAVEAYLLSMGAQ